MLKSTDETIAAVSTAPGEGGIGIVRISGPQALEVAEKVINPRHKRSLKETESHSIFLAIITDPENSNEIDEALVVTMKAPRTYTRENVVEIQCHGGTVAIRGVLLAVLKAGARIAEPGEFTKRAFLNGRIDLAQAEAVMDIIKARSDAGLQSAKSQLDGGLSSQINKHTEKLLDILAQVEASIDFSDEDIETLPVSVLTEQLQDVQKKIDGLLRTAFRGRIIKEGLRTIIAGRPNAGKSSLLNALLRRERAIVTDIPGTTRDIIEEAVIVNGIPLVLKDTAGLRSARDEAERIGIELTNKAIEDAELVLYVIDGSTEIGQEDIDRISALDTKNTLLVINKNDIGLHSSAERYLEIKSLPQYVQVSATTGSGIEELEQYLANYVSTADKSPDNGVLLTNARHEQLLSEALANITEALEVMMIEANEEIVATLLRASVEDLLGITGERIDEDILIRIFSQFCIGK